VGVQAAVALATGIHSVALATGIHSVLTTAARLNTMHSSCTGRVTCKGAARNLHFEFEPLALRSSHTDATFKCTSVLVLHCFLAACTSQPTPRIGSGMDWSPAADLDCRQPAPHMETCPGRCSPGYDTVTAPVATCIMGEWEIAGSCKPKRKLAYMQLKHEE
jgi:hypothetical protein